MKRLLTILLFLALSASNLLASWTSANTLGATGSKTANQASLALTTSAAAEADHVVIVCVATDNNQTTDGDEGAVSSITDSAGGNTWTKAREFTNGQGTAQNGAVASLWYSKLTNQIANGGTITANFTNSASRDATGIAAWEFTISDTTHVLSVAGSTDLATDALDPGAITISSLTSQEYLWAHCLAGEGPSTDAYTWDADYTQLGQGGTTGGGAATNMHGTGGFRIFTGTTDTVDVTSTTADRDYAQVYAAIKEAAPPACVPNGLAAMGAGC